ncbi:MAG: helix-turn-helix domain-containing protein [Candidatus Omnitrophica bacterium]|nr:helix-turn-helix domain-containing protein [Candidatus Omnitrophota bacterium]
MSQVLTFDEAKQFLRITASTLYRLVQNGVVPASKVGGQWRFKQERLEGWLSDQEVKFKDRNLKKEASGV